MHHASTYWTLTSHSVPDLLVYADRLHYHVYYYMYST